MADEEGQARRVVLSEALGEGLLKFFAGLRAEGLKIGVGEFAAAQDLLVALAALGGSPCAPETLRHWLAPVVCSTPRDQGLFYRRFDEWLARHPEFWERPVEPPRLPPEGLAGRLKIAAAGRWQRGAAWAFLLLGTIAAPLLFSPPPTRTLAGVVVDKVDGRPIPGADIWVAFMSAYNPGRESSVTDHRGHVSTDAAGRFSITLMLPGTDAYVNAASRPDYSEITQQVPLDHAGARDIRIALSRLGEGTGSGVGVGAPAQRLTPAPTPAPTPEQSGGWAAFYASYSLFLRAAEVALLPLFILGWWWLRHRPLRLRRGSSAQVPELRRLELEGVGGRLFRGEMYRRTIQKLRLHEEVVSQNIDVAATVAATVAEGDFFTPVYATRQVSPEYLALVERAGFNDQQARYVDSLLDRMKAEGVYVERFYFEGSPRACRERAPGSPQLPLGDLATRYAEHRLLIFGDGGGLLDRLTGRPYQFLESLPWARKSLFTPEPVGQWSYREYVLSRQGFHVLPIGEEGLQAFAESVQAGAHARPQEREDSRQFPGVLRERPARWSQRRPPTPEEVERLRAQLRYYLGDDGYYWLCACAAYPLLHWDVTLYLGRHLSGEGGRPLLDEERLLALVRLPWFRAGSLPEWLRLELLADLSAGQEREVRAVLKRLLLTALGRGQGQRFALEFAQRRPLLDLFRRLPEDHQLNDYVFISFLSGRRFRRGAALDVPQALRRILYNRGRNWLGLRLTTAATLALLSGFAVWYAIGGPVEPDPASIKLHLSLNLGSPVRAVAFSPDGKTVAGGGDDGSIKLWDTSTGEPAARQLPPTHSDAVTTLAFSPDGILLASGSADNNVILWNMTQVSQIEIGSKIPLGNAVTAVAFSPDGGVVACASRDGRVRVLDSRRGQQLISLSYASTPTWAVAYSPDGTLIAAGGDDGSVKLFEAKTGALKRELRSRHDGAVNALAFSHATDGKLLLASGGDDSKAIIWDVEAGTPTQMLMPGGVVNSVAFSPADTYLITGSFGRGGNMRVWGVADGQVKATLVYQSSAVTSVAVSASGQIVSGSDNGKVVVWK